MASRAAQHRKKKMGGNTRMDAALDAMCQLGFARSLVRATVKELLDVYDGNQGWPFIEETSYKLLIETILSKQQGSTEEDKDDARDSVDETSTRNSEAGPSGLVAQNHGQLIQDNASVGNLETDVSDSTVPTDRVEHEQDMNKSKNDQNPEDNVKGSKDSTVVTNVERTFDNTPMIQSSETLDHVPCRQREGYHGWIGNGSDDDDDGGLISFPIPPLSEQIEKLILQCEPPQSGSGKRRRKSRWDEKPEDM